MNCSLYKGGNKSGFKKDNHKIVSLEKRSPFEYSDSSGEGITKWGAYDISDPYVYVDKEKP